MTKKTVVTSYNVVVEIPQVLRWHGVTCHTRTHDEMVASCERVKSDILRHVDLDDRNGVYVKRETEDQCSHCGSAWTEGDSPHNGGCCDEDCAVMEGSAK